MNRDNMISLLLSPNGPEKLAGLRKDQEEKSAVLAEVLDLVSGTSVYKGTEADRVQAAALAFLIRTGKQKAYAEKMNEILPDKKLSGLLTAGDSKIRKNAARLIGTLDRKSMDTCLAEALKKETVRMVRPSMILSLGTLGTAQCREILQQWAVEPASDATEEKHALEEKEALRKALSRTGAVSESTENTENISVFKGWNAAENGHPEGAGKIEDKGTEPDRSIHKIIVNDAVKDTDKDTVHGSIGKVTVELHTEKGFEQALAEEVKEKRAGRVKAVRPGCVTVEETSPEKIWMVRSFKEFLIPMGTVKETAAPDRKRKAEMLAEKLDAYMSAMHEGNGPWRFRLETGKTGTGETGSRRSDTALLASAIEEASHGKLINAPGNYVCELRVHTLAKSGDMAAYLKLFTLEDPRFSYRQKTIAASIHPAGAAGLMQIARKYTKEGAVVMDPCCGSGTLLLERAHLQKKKPSVLLGIDISVQALTAAEANIRASAGYLKGTKIRLMRKDMLAFETSIQADELYANLPFGNRVGSHKENMELYSGLFDRLPRWLKQGGIAVLYSMEGKLLQTEAHRHPELEILKTQRVEAGGLEPLVMILRVR